MNTVIFKWNPQNSGYTMLQYLRDISESIYSGPFELEFIVKDYDKIKEGDRFYLMKLGYGANGIVASGEITSNPLKSTLIQDDTWEVLIEFQIMLNPDALPLLDKQTLKEEIPDFDWAEDTSGVVLNDEQASKLEDLWQNFLDSNQHLFEESIANREVNNDKYYHNTLIDLALEIATKAHKGQLDLNGKPAILHPLAVGMKGRNQMETACGFLHDVVGDTDYTIDDLINAGIPDYILEVLVILINDDNMPYMDYINQICESQNKTAIAVKLNDLEHNILRDKRSRIESLFKKHTEAKEYIENYLKTNKISLTDDMPSYIIFYGH